MHRADAGRSGEGKTLLGSTPQSDKRSVHGIGSRAMWKTKDGSCREGSTDNRSESSRLLRGQRLASINGSRGGSLFLPTA